MGPSPMPLMEILTTEEATRVTKSANDSGAACRGAGAAKKRADRTARKRARHKPMLLLQAKTAGLNVPPGYSYEKLTYSDLVRQPYFAGSFGLPATGLPVPSGLP